MNKLIIENLESPYFKPCPALTEPSFLHILKEYIWKWLWQGEKSHQRATFAQLLKISKIILYS